MLRHAKESLEYLPAFKGLREEEMDLLFTLASNRERGVIALKRVARFLLRERYLHVIPRNADANALLVLAELLLRLDPVGGRSRIDTGTFSHHRALSAWWWSATLKNIRLTSDPASVREQADQLEAWLRAGASPGDDPPVIANANQFLGRQDGMARAGYRNKNHPLGQLVRSVLWRVEPVDFVTGEPMIGMKLVESSGVSRDDQQRVEREQEHHVFPRSWLKRHPSVRDGHDVDQIANIALISEATKLLDLQPPATQVRRRSRHSIREVTRRSGAGIPSPGWRTLTTRLLRRTDSDPL